MYQTRLPASGVSVRSVWELNICTQRSAFEPVPARDAGHEAHRAADPPKHPPTKGVIPNFTTKVLF